MYQAPSFARGVRWYASCEGSCEEWGGHGERGKAGEEGENEGYRVGPLERLSDEVGNR